MKNLWSLDKPGTFIRREMSRRWEGMLRMESSKDTVEPWPHLKTVRVETMQRTINYSGVWTYISSVLRYLWASLRRLRVAIIDANISQSDRGIRLLNDVDRQMALVRQLRFAKVRGLENRDGTILACEMLGNIFQYLFTYSTYATKPTCLTAPLRPKTSRQPRVQ